jgi:hypothetical protein
LPQLFRRWQGHDVNIQPENPALAKERPQLDFTPKRVTVSRAAMSRLRATRVSDPGHDGRPHNSARTRGDSR